MEITLEAIISLITLFVGGTGVTGFFFWRQHKRTEEANAKRAEAEAKQADAEAKLKEVEAKAAEVDMAQKIQDTYQQMLSDKETEVQDNHRLIEELRQDRDHYKRDRDELRNELERLSKQFLQFKMDDEKEKIEMKRDIARNGRMVECMRPFLCGLAPECKKCVPVTISASGELEKTIKPKGKAASVEPLDRNDL